jgi:16S rRNA (adenine1518-N6/adenine1519-N6)-dimethyltransferase
MPPRRRGALAGPLLDETRRLLRRHGLQARKSLGQHFLVDPGVLECVIEAAELTAADTVVEVGPGLGVLTERLVRAAGRVLAVELDDGLAAALAERLAPFGNATVVNGNILGVDLAGLLGGKDGPPAYKVVANLPYYVTSPVLRHFLEAPSRPVRMVLMVQREVADRIAARPGRMSLLSVSVQLYGDPEVVRVVPAASFHPPPEVDSAVLRIDVLPEPRVTVRDEAAFFDVVRAGFSASRKQLANSLAQGLDTSKAKVLPLLAAAGISASRRAESLSLEEWAILYEACAAAGVGP